MADPTDPTDAAVRQQYEAWSYPDPRIGADRRGAWNCPSVFGPLYWPAGAPADPLRILVAGCGTTEAVQLAARNPAARVVGIDVSQASLAHARDAAAAQGIENLDLRRLALEQVAALDQAFDFISVGGVLHHLADPVAGLAALGAVLADDGVVSAAVYATHSRTGLRLTQQLFAKMGLGRSAEDVAMVRQVLAALPADHPVRVWMQSTGEQGALDSHVVDTWLNAREVGFDVAGVLALVDQAGLAFQGWQHNTMVFPDATFGPGHPAHERLLALGVPAVWSAMELARPFNDHTFFATRPDRPAHTWQIDFAADDFGQWVPARRHPPHMPHPPLPYDHRDPLQTRLYQQIDGRTTVRAMLVRAGFQGDPAALDDFARRFLAHLWRKDAVFIRLPPLGGWPQRELLEG